MPLKNNIAWIDFCFHSDWTQNQVVQNSQTNVYIFVRKLTGKVENVARIAYIVVNPYSKAIQHSIPRLKQKKKKELDHLHDEYEKNSIYNKQICRKFAMLLKYQIDEF